MAIVARSVAFLIAGLEAITNDLKQPWFIGEALQCGENVVFCLSAAH